MSTRTAYANRESLATLVPGELVIQDVNIYFLLVNIKKVQNVNVIYRKIENVQIYLFVGYRFPYLHSHTRA